jgi:Ca2+-binding EF-hand superfamily protein
MLTMMQERAKGNNGAINRRMFREVLCEMLGEGSVMESKDVDALFDTLDRNGGGQLQVDELTEVLNFIVNPDGDIMAAGGAGGTRRKGHTRGSAAIGGPPASAPPKGVLASINALMAKSANSNPVQALRDSLSDQASRVIDLFKRWDLNSDGKISRKEFARGTAELGMMHCLPNEINVLFDVFDTDGSGEISFRELHQMLRNKGGTDAATLAGLAAGAGGNGRGLAAGAGGGSGGGGGGVQLVDVKALRAQTRSSVLLMCLQAEMAGAPLSVDQMTGEIKAMPPLNVDAVSMAGQSEAALNALEGALRTDVDQDGLQDGDGDGEVPAGAAAALVLDATREMDGVGTA